MKQHPFIILLVVAGIIALFAASYLALQQKPDDESKLTIMIDSLVTRMFGPEEVALVANEESPYLARVEASTLVRGNGFSLDVPAAWAVGDVQADARELDGRLQYGWMANRQPIAMDSGENLVIVSVYDVLKDEEIDYDAVVATHAWDADDVKAIVSFMKSEASDIYPDFSEADVRTEVIDETIAGEPVKKATLECLKPCYIEGGATTSIYYFVEAPDRVYLIYVTVAKDAQSEALLAEADAVVKTFRIDE